MTDYKQDWVERVIGKIFDLKRKANDAEVNRRIVRDPEYAAKIAKLRKASEKAHKKVLDNIEKNKNNPEFQAFKKKLKDNPGLADELDDPHYIDKYL